MSHLSIGVGVGKPEKRNSEAKGKAVHMQYCGVRVPSRPALQRLAAGDAASDSDAAEPESPAQKRHIIITRLGGASVRLAAVQNAKRRRLKKDEIS